MRGREWAWRSTWRGRGRGRRGAGARAAAAGAGGGGGGLLLHQHRKSAGADCVWILRILFEEGHADQLPRTSRCGGYAMGGGALRIFCCLPCCSLQRSFAAPGETDKEDNRFCCVRRLLRVPSAGLSL